MTRAIAMSIKLLINVTRDQQIEVEETCLNMGKSLSDYFLDLHKNFMKNKKAENLDNSLKEMCATENSDKESIKLSKKTKKSLN